MHFVDSRGPRRGAALPVVDMEHRATSLLSTAQDAPRNISILCVAPQITAMLRELRRNFELDRAFREGPTRGPPLPLALDALVDLFAVYRHTLRSIDVDSHLMPFTPRTATVTLSPIFRFSLTRRVRMSMLLFATHFSGGLTTA